MADTHTRIETSIEHPQSFVERKTADRLEDDRELRVFEAWLESIDSRVLSRVLTPEERNRRIALALLRKEKKLKREKEKNKIDPLSGMGRQEHLKPKLDEMISRGKPFAVLFTDLDNFSIINDKYGHPAGDEIIAQTGLRIQEGLRDETSAREGDEAFVGDPFRNGGDEAAIVLPDVSSRENLVLIGNRIRSLINDTPFTVPQINEKIGLTVSIGGLIWDGIQSKEEFIITVDDYLYKAKRARGSLVIQ